MPYTRVIQFLLMVACVVVTMGCQQGTTPLETLNGKTPLIQSADGKSYDVGCLKRGSPQTMTSCEVNLTDNGESSTKNARGIYSGYYDYYYWNLFGFNQSDFCSYLWGTSSCYSYFGYTQPSYNYSYGNSCSSSYLYGYSGRVPYYCYWNYYSNTSYTNVRLKMKVVPVNGVTTEPAKKIIYLDNSGRVVKKVCTTETSCTSTIIEYIDSTMQSAIENLITQARSGTILRLDTTGTVACFAMATTNRTYVADNNTVFLRTGNAPCGGDTVYYNDSDAASKLVQKLDSWATY